MPRLLSPLLAALITSIVALPSAEAAVGDICVRDAQAVPGAQVKHPQWWNPALSESQREVRWTGATTRTDADAAAPELASSRMIWHQASHRVFFEFEVQADTSIDTQEDLVLLAVSNASGDAPELFIQFQPLRGCAPATNCEGSGAPLGAASVSYSVASGGGTSATWSTLTTVNPNPDFIVEQPWVEVREVESGGSTTYNWSLKFALQVPVVAGQIRPDLRVYGNTVMFMQGPTSGTAVEFPLLCNPSSETSNDCLIFSSGGGSALPNDLPSANMAATWPVLDSSDPDGCGGIELVRPLVGSNYNMSSGTIPGTAIPYTLPGSQIPYADGASFRAGFHNDTDVTLTSGDITAEFRIANWGLQYASWGDATWNLVANATLVGTVTPGGWSNAFGQGTLQSDVWVPATSGLSLENNHQCVHVRLKAHTAVPMAVDSVYRNMNLVGASVVQRPAEINLVGRKLPKGHSKHEVYLLVRSEHMPDPAACKRSKNKLYGCAKGGKLIAQHKAFTKNQRAALEKEFDRGNLKMSKAEFDALMVKKARKGKKPEELPFYAVYGMVDTGRVINLPGAKKTPVLEPFSAYGYYVEHEGMPAEGWEHFIHGVTEVEGKTNKGAHNLFKLEVDPGKVASVANTVRVLSKETKACSVRPKPTAAVYDTKKTRELENRIKADIGKGKAADVGKVRVTDGQLGCEPPPLRFQCDPATCPPPSPAATIEHSTYVGDFTLAPRAKKPSAKKPSAKKPAGKKPSAKKPAPPAGRGRRPGRRRVGGRR